MSLKVFHVTGCSECGVNGQYKAFEKYMDHDAYYKLDDSGKKMTTPYVAWHTAFGGWYLSTTGGDVQYTASNSLSLTDPPKHGWSSKLGHAPPFAKVFDVTGCSESGVNGQYKAFEEYSDHDAYYKLDGSGKKMSTPYVAWHTAWGGWYLSTTGGDAEYTASNSLSLRDPPKHGWSSKHGHAPPFGGMPNAAICVGNTYGGGSKMNPLKGDRAASRFEQFFAARRFQTFKRIDIGGGHQLPDAVQQIIENHVTEHTESLVVTFNGHGSAGHVWGQDGKPTAFAEILEKMDHWRLRGKNKILLLDCCLGSADTEIHMQGNSNPVPKGCDFVIGYACADGTVSWGGPDGGVYSNTLIDVMSSQSGKINLTQTLKSVNARMRTAQNPVATHFNDSTSGDVLL